MAAHAEDASRSQPREPVRQVAKALGVALSTVSARRRAHAAAMRSLVRHSSLGCRILEPDSCESLRREIEGATTAVRLRRFCQRPSNDFPA